MTSSSQPPRGQPTRATVNDVASAAGVSRQTVSNVLNRPERVRPETRERVERVVAELGYHPSDAARRLRQERAGAVGVELNTLGDSPGDVVHPLLVELSLAAPRHGCHLVPFASRDAGPMLAGYEAMVRRRLVDAFVLTDTHHDDPRPGWLDEAGIPYAAFGRVYDDPAETRWADVDGRAGTREAVRHLIEQGYEQVGYLGWPAGSEVGDARREGWRQGLAEKGLPPGPEQACEQHLDTAVAAAGRLLEDLAPGGAVVCASDLLAVGVLHAAHDRGHRLGPDVGVTGFDGGQLARMHDLTTLAQPLADIADHCLTLVHALLAGGSRPERGTLLTPTLTVGGSTDRTKEGTP